MSKRKEIKYYFYLKNVDIENIDKKYGLVRKSNILEPRTPNNNITPISNLNVILGEDMDNYCFLDETKKKHECVLSTIKHNELNKYSNCFWCRHSFNTLPIGCPIKFEHSYVLKKFYSHITKNWYTLKESVSEKQLINYVNQDGKYKVINKNYYITDGVFCSFNCCLAFINDNKHNKLYNNSIQLLNQFYYNIYNKEMGLDSANSWRLLKEYGGNQTINDFRNNFKKVSYVDHYIVENIPQNKPIGHIYEKKIKF